MVRPRMDSNVRPRLVPELLCRDVQASLAFYRNIIGFEVLYERPEEGFAYLSLSGAELMLEQAQQFLVTNRGLEADMLHSPYWSSRLEDIL